jgi:hypothetical protein
MMGLGVTMDRETMVDLDADTDWEQAAQPAPTFTLPTASRGVGNSAQEPQVRARPRWKITSVGHQTVSATADATAQLAGPRRPAGTPGTLTDRFLVQTSAGAQLEAVLPYVDQARGGLVLGRGRMTNRVNLRQLITGLPERGFTAPVVFDPEGYRHHVATTEAPFCLLQKGMFTETLEENLSNQRALGVDVAQTPTGLIRGPNVHALEVAAEEIDRLSRDDFMVTAPLDVTILDDPTLTDRVWRILNGMRAPISLVLACQFDPFDTNAKARIAALRSLAAGPADVAAMRTDFNAFDLLCHGSFTGAIGSGGSMRHATDPDERPRSFDPEDESPSVLYERLACWWRGSKIAREHGRLPAPGCDCGPCDNRRISRFLSRDDSDDARAHGLIIWQRWSKLILAKPTIGERAAFWRTFCQGRVSEYDVLSEQLRRAKTLQARPALKAWAELPA